ncbi:hypothetical protein Tco_0723248 [Tanacetum coccineum]
MTEELSTTAPAATTTTATPTIVNNKTEGKKLVEPMLLLHQEMNGPSKQELMKQKAPPISNQLPVHGLPCPFWKKDGNKHLPLVEISYKKQLSLPDPEKFKKPLKDRTNFVNSLASCKRRQRSYANIRRKPLEFQVGNRVCEVTPSTRHIELPEKLSSIHNTFNVSNLKKCLSDESFVIPINELQLDDKLNFVEEPVEVMDREIKQLKRSRIPIIKVRWNSKRGPEFTWEREDKICAKYPHLFSIITSSSIKSRDEISVRGGDYNNPQFS